MTLKDWLESTGETTAEFATRIGRTSESVRRYVAGERIPDRDTMPLIAEVTGGAVMPNDFFGIDLAAAGSASQAAARLEAAR